MMESGKTGGGYAARASGPGVLVNSAYQRVDPDADLTAARPRPPATDPRSALHRRPTKTVGDQLFTTAPAAVVRPCTVKRCYLGGLLASGPPQAFGGAVRARMIRAWRCRRITGRSNS